MDLQEAFDAGFEAVKTYVDDALAAFEQRIKALESREPSKGEPGADGRDGKDADPEVTAQLVREEVEKAVAAIPAPQDGKSVTVEDVEPLIAERVSAAVSDAVKAMPVPQDGKDGKDGRDGLDAVTPILKDGTLLFTMSDGSVKEVGRVVGENGKDGADGRDGVDGLGFDDLSAEYDGERTVTLKMKRGEQVKEFAFEMPVVIDRGVYREGEAYAKGDAVTWAGSVWIAQKATDQKPDSGDGWRLAVKRGRDGKPGKDGELKAKQPVKVGA